MKKRSKIKKKKVKLAIALLVFNPVQTTYVVLYLCNVFYVAINKERGGVWKLNSHHSLPKITFWSSQLHFLYENTILIICHKCDLEALTDTKVEGHLPFVLTILLYIWMDTLSKKPSIYEISSRGSRMHTPGKGGIESFLFVII